MSPNMLIKLHRRRPMICNACSSPPSLLFYRQWDATNTSGKYISTKFILSDEFGSTMHCIARSSIAHCFEGRLATGEIYSISRFTVIPVKPTYRICKDNKHILQLEGNTVVKKLDCSSVGFIRHPLSFVAIEDIELNGSQFLIDVIGSVINIGKSKPTRNGTQLMDFHLMNDRGRTIRVTLWGALCDELVKKVGVSGSLHIAAFTGLNVREF